MYAQDENKLTINNLSGCTSHTAELTPYSCKGSEADKVTILLFQ